LDDDNVAEPRGGKRNGIRRKRYDSTTEKCKAEECRAGRVFVKSGPGGTGGGNGYAATEDA